MSRHSHKPDSNNIVQSFDSLADTLLASAVVAKRLAEKLATVSEACDREACPLITGRSRGCHRYQAYSRS